MNRRPQARKCKCSVPNCTTVKTPSKVFNKIFFTYPKCEKTKKIWAEACNIPIESIKKTTRICIDHFESKHISDNKRLILSTNPIPTIFNCNSDKLDTIDFCSECHEHSDSIIVLRGELGEIKKKVLKQNSYDKRSKCLKDKIKKTREESLKADKMIKKLRQRLRRQRNQYTKLNALSIELITCDE